jgi:hypothetical protein
MFNNKEQNYDGCKACPAHTVPNTNHQYCVAESNENFGTGTYLLGNITGLTSGIDGYTGGLCTRKSLTLYCHNSFYGPLPGDGDEYYYLSVLNPSKPNIPNYYQLDDLPTVYAIGVLNATRFNLDPVEVADVM